MMGRITMGRRRVIGSDDNLYGASKCEGENEFNGKRMEMLAEQRKKKE